MIFAKPFIELQYTFAEILVQNFGLEILDTLFNYTNLYLLLTSHIPISKENKIWMNFAEEYKNNSDYIYHKYIKAKNDPTIELKKDRVRFGCFSYHLEQDNKTAKIHFSNNDNSGFGPLSKERIIIRKKEISDMLDNIKESPAGIQYIRGKSWLYSLESYKRLFPKSFIKSLVEYEGEEWQYMTRWGQFLDSEGNVKTELAKTFLECAKQKKNINNILRCFPFKVYTGCIKIKNFY